MQHKDEKEINDTHNKVKEGLSKAAGAVIGGVEGLLLGALAEPAKYIAHIVDNQNHRPQSEKRDLKEDFIDGVCVLGAISLGPFFGAVKGAKHGAIGGVSAGANTAITLFTFSPDTQKVLKRIAKDQKRHSKWQTKWHEDDSIKLVRQNLAIELKHYPQVYKKLLENGTLLTAEEKKIEAAYRELVAAVIVMMFGATQSSNPLSLLTPDLIILIATCLADNALVKQTLAMKIANEAYHFAISAQPIQFNHIHEVINKIVSIVYDKLNIELIHDHQTPQDEKINNNSL
jgi:hypothetical protein